MFFWVAGVGVVDLYLFYPGIILLPKKLTRLPTLTSEYWWQQLTPSFFIRCSYMANFTAAYSHFELPFFDLTTEYPPPPRPPFTTFTNLESKLPDEYLHIGHRDWDLSCCQSLHMPGRQWCEQHMDVNRDKRESLMLVPLAPTCTYHQHGRWREVYGTGTTAPAGSMISRKTWHSATLLEIPSPWVPYCNIV